MQDFPETLFVSRPIKDEFDMAAAAMAAEIYFHNCAHKLATAWAENFNKEGFNQAEANQIAAWFFSGGSNA